MEPVSGQTAMLPSQTRLSPAYPLLVTLLLMAVVGVLSTNNSRLWAGSRSSASDPGEEARAVRRARLLQGFDHPKRAYRPGEVLVRFRPGTTDLQKVKAHNKANALLLKSYPSVPLLDRVAVPQGTSVEEAVAKYRSQPNVLYAEPNYIVHADQAAVTPNDPRFNQQWNLHNTGQGGGTSGADIHAPEAWSTTTGSTNVVVAVIDSGIDYTHPDLASQAWSAPAPFTVTRTQGDVFTCPAGSHGFDAVNGDCDPQDDVGHGTHVSGIIGAATNNATGVAGINWSVRVLACKFLDNQGFGDTAGALTCLEMIKSLKDGGINIVATNNSWGGSEFSQALSDAIAAQAQSGILFVAAAGNDFYDTDLAPVYPADYYQPNIISVAASTNRDEFAGFTNLGRRTTHLTAPGDQILSTTPDNTYSIFSGTSMASPHVTGVAALLAAQDSNRDWRGIRNLILSGGDLLPALSTTVTGRRLNAAGSLGCSNKVVQSRLLPISDTVSTTSGTPVTISAISINCEQAAGPVQATITPGGQKIALADDGAGSDQFAGDGLFTGRWTPPATGSYTVSFAWGDTFQIEVLNNYSYAPTAYNYSTISGTNLNLGDDTVVQVSSPFPISYGGGSLSNLFVGSNGTISFTDAYSDYINSILPPGLFPPMAIPQATTLVAPWWQDLFPVKGTAQNVFWGVTGATPNRKLVVEWRDVRTFQCSNDPRATVKFQVVFSEGKSDVLFNYADTAFGGSCINQDHGALASIGLQQSLITGQMYSYYGENVHDGFSLLWTIPTSAPVPNPLPTLTSISPSSTLRGGPGITLTVNGTNFVPTSRVQYGGKDHVTTYVNSTTLTAPLDTTDLNPIMSSDVAVFTPSPGGGTSQSLTLTLLNPAPVLTSISPSSVTANGLTFELTAQATGVQFGNSAIYWNGQPLPYGFWLDTNTLEAQVPYGYLSTPGTAQITIQTGPPGGGTSNALPLVIAPNTTGGGFGSAPQTPSQLVQRARPLVLDQAGQVQGATGRRMSPPMRFLGWNYGRTAGPAYQHFFTRLHGGSALPLSATAKANLASKVGEVVAMGGGTAGAPGFGFRPTLPADYIPTSVATGDFNGDGHLDWAVTNGGSNSIWIYLGKGDGTSQLPTIIPLAGQAPIQVVAADLRKNGKLDLIVGEADSGTVGVLLGNGNGTFQPETVYYAPAPVVTVAAGDFDGDGKIDVVAGLIGNEFTGPLAFFGGDGAGRIGTAITRPPENYVGSFYTFTMQVSDLNGDGLPDVVGVDVGGVVYGPHAYLSSGDGTFKDAGYIFGGSPFVSALNAAAGDMDGDGCPDLVTSTDAGIVYLFHGNCNGTFIGFPDVFFVGAGDTGAGLVLTDMNGDGKLDVVTSGITLDVDVYGPDTGNTVAVLFGDGHGKLTPGRIYRGQPGMFNIAAGDLNGDGRPDIVTANQDSDSVSIYLNNGTGGFGDPLGTYVGPMTDGKTGGSINDPYSGPLVADVNGDGKPDILFLEYPVPNPFAWQLTVLLNDGTGHYGAPVRSPAFEGTFGIYDLQLADVRGNGQPDLLVMGADLGYSQFLGYAPNLGNGTFGPLKIVPMAGSLTVFAAGDFDGDGKLDLVVAGGSGLAAGPIDRLLFMKGQGNGSFSVGPSIDFGQLGVTGGSPRNTFVADFNHDHKLDLIVTVNDQTIGPGSLPHPAFEFFGNGDGTFQPPTILLPETAYLSMADVNHDGNPDLIELVSPITIQGFSTPTYKIHLGMNDGTFVDGATHTPFGGLITFASGGPSALRFYGPAVADFDGDGNLDILAPQRYADWNATTGGPVFSRGYFQLLLGKGDGTFVPDYAVFDLAKINPPNVVADVNGDGKADLIEVDPFPSSYNVVLAKTGSALQTQMLANPIIGTLGTLRLIMNPARASVSTITLSASDPNISIASSINVPAGTSIQDVPFTIGPGFNRLHVFALQAQLGADSATAYGNVAQPGLNAGFQLFLYNTTESAVPGSVTPDYTLSVMSVNGYSTAVHLQCTGLPAGATCQFGNNPANVLPGTFATVPLIVSVSGATAAGNYTFRIVGSDGSISVQATATLVVTSFALNLSPGSSVIFPGQVANYMLTFLAPGSSQTIPVSCKVTPPGPSCSLDGQLVGPGQTSFQVDPKTASPADFTVIVSGTMGSGTQTVSTQLKLEDAALAVSKTAATVSVGSSTDVNVTLTSANGFSDQFTFSCMNLPAGMGCSFAPPSGSLPASGQLTTVLTIKVNAKPNVAYVPLRHEQAKPLALFASLPTLIAAFLVFAYDGSGRKRARKKMAIALTAGSILMLLILVACGGSAGGTSTPPPPPPPPSTAATVHIQVQASSPTLTRTSTTLTITIP